MPKYNHSYAGRLIAWRTGLRMHSIYEMLYHINRLPASPTHLHRPFASIAMASGEALSYDPALPFQIAAILSFSDSSSTSDSSFNFRL